MFFDKELIFSENQSVTNSAASSNIVEIGENAGAGEALKLYIKVKENFASDSAATLKVSLQGSDDSAFTTPVELISSAEIGKDVLVAGKSIEMGSVPAQHGKFIRLYYTTDAVMTAGKITSAVVLDVQS